MRTSRATTPPGTSWYGLSSTTKFMSTLAQATGTPYRFGPTPMPALRPQDRQRSDRGGPVRHTLALGPLIGVVLLATACGSGPTASSDAMSPEALARQFGACNLPDAGPVYSIMSDLTGTKRWLQVIEVPAEAIPTTAPGWDQDWDLATPQVVVLEDGVRRTERLRIHASFLTVVPWAERNDAGVWFAMATADSGAGEDTVAYPIVVLPTGDGFIPGQCMDLVYDQRMQKEYGADWALLLGRLPGTTKAEAREILGVPEPRPSPATKPSSSRAPTAPRTSTTSACESSPSSGSSTTAGSRSPSARTSTRAGATASTPTATRRPTCP